MLSNQDLRRIIKACIDLTNETDRNHLLSSLLDAAMDITRCDAGTIYQKNGDMLEFRVMKTISLGIDRGAGGEATGIPPAALKEENVCGYCAIHGELINIPDVYTSDRFDFKGPKNYDAITGYRTRSMLVIPIQNEKKKLVGVMQLMNAKDDHGRDWVFSAEDEFVLRALGSMTAVLILNMNYTEDVRRQMHSFVSSFATAVDQRTPYNGSHTRKVTAYASLLAKEINKKHERGECPESFDTTRLENLELAASLHDIGKMIIPLEVMNKETRLGSRLQHVEDRFELLHVLYDRDFYKGRLNAEENAAFQSELDDALTFIHTINAAGFLPDEQLEKLTGLAAKSYEYEDGKTLPYLSEEELHHLSIRKGTLTSEEREIMENHVVMTKLILSEVYFNEEYAPVPEWAASHHELLDGSGYPDHLKGAQLGLETRMLAVVDIYDALTSVDRPYKKPIPKEKAFGILYEMADSGKLDKRLVGYLEDALKDDPEIL